MILGTYLIDGKPAPGSSVPRAARPLLNNGYASDKSDMREGDRFGALEELFDAGTIQLLSERGVAEGWHCLEVGAGRGSIAAWLSERVGPTGRVIATDINTRFLDTLQRPNLAVRRHNIVTDPLPEDEFDLVHVRLVLTLRSFCLPHFSQTTEPIRGADQGARILIVTDYDDEELPGAAM